MRFTYHTEQRVQHPPARVFDFFANPANLPLLMPAWQRARIEQQSLIAPPLRPGLEGIQPPAAGTGSHVTLNFRPLPGLPFRLNWKAEIAEFVWDQHFCDIQVSGPFAYWKHCHSIRSADGPDTEATVIADDVQYELPFGAAGNLAHVIFLRRQIERTFAYRQSQLASLLPLGPSAPQPVDA